MPYPSEPRVLLMMPDQAPSVGRLPRELVRQAAIAEALEGFDIVVRDGALGETIPNDVSESEVLDFRPWFLSHPPERDGELSIDVKPHRQSNWMRDEPKYAAALPPGHVPPSFVYVFTPGTPVVGLETTAADAVHALNGFSDFLKERGIKPRKDAGGDPATADREAEVESRLSTMSVVAQFDTVRAAHSLPPGPKKERLLAIGYSNLCLLTQHHWSPASKVFAARGLVYAERAARKEPGPAAEEARAYAAAMAGLHGAALRFAESSGADRSPRLQTVVAFCRFREDELLGLAEKFPEVRQLAAVLACLVVEPTRSSDLVARTYGALVEAAPDALRGYEPAATLGEIGLLHDVTVRGPGQLTRPLADRLRSVAELPEPVRELLAEGGGPCRPNSPTDSKPRRPPTPGVSRHGRSSGMC